MNWELMVCCLAPTENTALRGYAALAALAFPEPVPADAWDALWSTGEAPVSVRKEFSISAWGLEHTFIFIPDEPPIPAIGIVATDVWLDLTAWLLTPAALCIDGCPAAIYW